MNKRWLLSIVRVSLCVGALWLIGKNLHWQDAITLADGTSHHGLVTQTAEGWDVQTTEGKYSLSKAGHASAEANAFPTVRYGLRTVWAQGNVGYLFVAIAVFMMVPVMQGVRLRYLLGVESIHVTHLESFRLALVGNFFNFAVPFGSTSGDVVKAYSLSRKHERGTEAATVVMVDRALGLATLVFCVCLIAIVLTGDLRLTPLRNFFIGLTVALLAGAVLYPSRTLRQLLPIQWITSRWTIPTWIARVDRTTCRLMRNPVALIVAVLQTVLLQLFAAASFMAVAIALHMEVHAGDVAELYAYFSAGEIVKAVPGPPQGLGTMELAYTYFFGSIGSVSQIVTAAFAVRMVNLICALPGGLSMLTSKNAVQVSSAPSVDQDELALAA